MFFFNFRVNLSNTFVVLLDWAKFANTMVENVENIENSTFQQIIALFNSFFANSFDYLKVFIPLLIIYKAYLKYHDRIYSGKL
jgi:hypothetical protein